MISTIKYDAFQVISVTLQNVYAPLKKKYLKTNHASFGTKELRKAITQRIRPRNIYLKQWTETTKVAYNQQTNNCVNILMNSKDLILKVSMWNLLRKIKNVWRSFTLLFKQN